MLKGRYGICLFRKWTIMQQDTDLISFLLSRNRLHLVKALPWDHNSFINNKFENIKSFPFLYNDNSAWE